MRGRNTAAWRHAGGSRSRAASILSRKFEAQYRRLAARRGQGRALLAVGNTILVIAYLLKDGATCQELGGDFFERLDPGRLTRSLVRRLEKLGHKVTVETQGGAGRRVCYPHSVYRLVRRPCHVGADRAREPAPPEARRRQLLTVAGVLALVAAVGCWRCSSCARRPRPPTRAARVLRRTAARRHCTRSINATPAGASPTWRRPAPGSPRRRTRLPWSWPAASSSPS